MFWLLPWALTAEVGIFIVLIFLVQLEKFGWSTTLMIVSLVVYSILAHYLKWPSLKGLFSKDNYWEVLKYFGYYLLGAILWSYGKWLFFLYEFKRTRDAAVEKFKEQRAQSNRLSETNEELRLDEIRTSLGHQRYKKSYLSSKVKARDYKAIIVSWAIWWPASLIGTLVDDPVRSSSTFSSIGSVVFTSGLPTGSSQRSSSDVSQRAFSG